MSKIKSQRSDAKLQMAMMIGLALGGTRMPLGFETVRDCMAEPVPFPPKPEYTEEENLELEKLYLDRTPHGRKIYKSYLKGLNK